MIVNGKEVQYRGGRSEKIHIKLRTSDLCSLFNCSRDTLYRWIRLERLDATDIRDVIDKFNNPNQLDKRRRRSAPLRNQ